MKSNGVTNLLISRIGTAFLVLIVFQIVQCAATSSLSRRNNFSFGGNQPTRSSWSSRFPGSGTSLFPYVLLRGGGIDSDDDGTAQQDEAADADDERYSRQVYAVGARAHGLIRSSIVYLDGPKSSGLLYECAKNLALSGVRKLVIVDDNDEDGDADIDEAYHSAELDDLGRAYQNAARSELKESKDEMISASKVLEEYLKRLNPSVLISRISRSSLEESMKTTNDKSNSNNNEDESRKILLCVDRPYPRQAVLNSFSRELGVSFVSVETAGVFGRTFCDFGPDHVVHDADGETPLQTLLDRVDHQNDADDLPQGGGGEEICLTVHCVDGEKHDVSKGDVIQFQLRNGNLSQDQFTVLDVKNPFRFVVKWKKDSATMEGGEKININDLASSINQEAVSFRRMKIPQQLSFESIKDAVESAKSDASLFTPCDLDKSFDNVRRSASMAFFQALPLFIEKEGGFPTEKDGEKFWKLSRATWLSDEDGDCKKYLKPFLRCCKAKFTPLQAVFGAIAAQEVLKAASGLYFPVKQFLLYDSDEVLDTVPPDPMKTVEGEDSLPDASSGLRYILGDFVVDKLQSKRVFVVGSGAIGCEILKNLAPMGVGTGKKGCVILTDMDTIEKSNLSRQLLFRDADIGKFKSTAAKGATLRFNPSMKIEAHSSKVGGADLGPFDDRFWSKKVDVVLNALDNMDARLYMDAQCVTNKKALVDAGTMGPKGNVQVVVPHQSESYSSSADPPEPAIPVCTLKNFPYAISHCIQWGRDMFDGLFQRRPNQANDFIESLHSSGSIENLASGLVQDMGDELALQAAEELNEDMVEHEEEQGEKVEAVRAEALKWASELAHKNFFKQVEELLKDHPRDSKDEDGEPFWSGSRKPPQPLSFVSDSTSSEQDTINENLIDFVRSTARLRTETFLEGASLTGDSLFTVEEVRAILEDLEETGSCPSRSSSDQSVLERVRACLSHLPAEARRLVAVEFEKDVESNGHVAFVAAASNLRALCYGIPPVDSMETRRVAGNIVPAMITTTAFVSALSCIELVKLVQKAQLRLQRNAFINLALPFFAFTIPLPAEKIPGLRGKQYTLWDRLVIKEDRKAAISGGLTMRSLLHRVRKLACDEPEVVEVSSVSFGPYLLYANFLHEDDESVCSGSLWNLLKEAISSSEEFDADFSRNDGDEEVECHYSEGQRYVDLKVVVEDVETGTEAELPTIRVERNEKK